MNNKYFSKALFFDERRTIIFPAGSIFILLFTNIIKFIEMYPVLLKNTDSDLRATSIFLSIPYVPILIICLLSVFYSYNNKESKYSFMLTQPFGRDAIIVTKTAAFITSYTLPIFLYGVSSSIIITSNNFLFGQNSKILLQSLFASLLTLFTILTFTIMIVQLMQMLFGKNPVAFTFPAVLTLSLVTDIGIIYPFISTKIPFLKNIIGRILDFILGNNGLTQSKGSHRDIFGLIDNFFNKSPLAACFVFVLISFSILLICILLNRKIKSENISGLFMFKPMENIFKIIISMLISVLLSLLIFLIIYFIASKVTGALSNSEIIEKLNLNLTDNMANILLIFIDILWVALTVFAYKMLGKAMNKRRIV